jgi:hypothetical protein
VPTEIEYRRPWLYRKQREALFCVERYGICEASTKAGKTVGCMAWLFEQALHGCDGKNYWWVAPILDQSRIAYNRFKRGIPRQVYAANEARLTLTLFNGAVLWFKGGDHPDSLYGEDVYAAVIDEATRCKPEVWYAVRSTLTATEGPVRIIGNVKGKKNWAYDLARAAERGEPGMHYAKLTAYDAIEAGVISEAEVEDARRVLPDAMFRELYLAEPADNLALIYAPFGVENITDEAEYVPDGGYLWLSYDWGFTDQTHICLIQQRDGCFYVCDELVGNNTSERSWVRAIVRRLLGLSDYDGPTLDEWVAIWDGQQPWPSPWPALWPTAAGDPSAPQFRHELKEHGIGVRPADKVRHKVEEGQDVLRAAILSGDGLRRLKVHPRCTRTIDALSNYRARELADGSFDPLPDPDPANHAYSHGADSLRYFMWTMRYALGLGERKEGERVNGTTV